MTEDFPGRRYAGVVRAAYVVVLLFATLSNLNYAPHGIGERALRMLRPVESARDAVDGLRNVALFAGWGLVWALTAARIRSATTIRNAVLSGAGLSLFVELVQLTSSSRTASFLDVATNTVGALIGAVCLVLAVEGLRRRRSRKSFVGIPALAFAGSYLVTASTEALIPLFRQVSDRSVYGGPARRLAAAFARFEWSSILHVPLTDILLFFPAGFLAVAALVEARGGDFRRSARVVAVAGVVGSVAIEVTHTLLGIPIHLGAIVAHAAGVAAGAATAAAALPAFTRSFRGRERPRMLLAIYAVVVLLWMLRPYVPVNSLSVLLERLSGTWWLPLLAQRMRVDVFSVGDVLAGFMLFLPLGALLAVWPLRRRGLLAGVLPAVYLAVASELGQFFIAARTVDVTDVLVEVAAAGAGWLMARRAGFAPYGEVLPERPARLPVTE